MPSCSWSTSCLTESSPVSVFSLLIVPVIIATWTTTSVRPCQSHSPTSQASANMTTCFVTAALRSPSTRKLRPSRSFVLCTLPNRPSLSFTKAKPINPGTRTCHNRVHLMFNTFLRIIMVVIYLATIVWSVQFNLIPIIEYHGVWTFVMMNLTFFVITFAVTFAFLILPRQPKPQATPRNFTSTRNTS